MFNIMRDYVYVQFDGFRDRLRKQDELKKEMIKRFGKIKPDDFKFKITFDNSFVIVEHINERELINR